MTKWKGQRGMIKWKYRFGQLGLLLLLALPVRAEQEVFQVVGLVLAVSFSDTDEKYIHPLKDLDAFFNDPDYKNHPANAGKNNGSLWNYFDDVSNGKFSLKHQVIQYQARETSSYYLDKMRLGKGVFELLDEVMLHLRDEVKFDFSKLSLNENREIIDLSIFYTSNSKRHDPDYITGYAPSFKKDYGAFKTWRVQICPQRDIYRMPDGTRPLALRTFAHEAGHTIFGWPDLYDLDGSSSGLGIATLMSGTGDYNNPLLPCPYLRIKEGWISVVDITDDPPGTVHKISGDGETVYRYRHPIKTNEYFLIDACVKAARKDGRFSSKKEEHPPEGLRIWHVDETGNNSREGMTPTSHYKVSVEQADGRFDLERGKNGGDKEDTFYNGNVTRFDDTTTPSANWWDGAESGLRIVKVSTIKPEMIFQTHHKKSPVFVDNARPFQIRQTVGYLNFPSSSYKLTHLSRPRKWLSWQAKASVPWIELSPKSGRLKPGEEVTITAKVSASAMKKLSGKTGEASAIVAIVIPGTKTLVHRKIDITVEAPVLLHHWTLDETKGTTLADSVAKEASDILFRREHYLKKESVEGPLGRGVKIDRHNTLSTDLGGRVSGTLTLCGWVKIPVLSVGKPQSIFYFLNEGAGMTLSNTGKLNYRWGRRFGWIGLEIEPDEWTFVALTIEPDQATVTLFTPGEEPRRKIFEGKPHDPLELTYLYLGGSSARNTLNGAIDDVRIYNYPLSEEELRTLVETGPLK